MDDVEWKPLPTPMLPLGSIVAGRQGLFLEVSFEEDILTWEL